MPDTTPRSGRSRATVRARTGTEAASTRRARTERGMAASPPASPATAPGAPGEPPVSPLDVQLAVMCALYHAAHRNGRIVDFEMARQACDIAKSAAPYVHARVGAAGGGGAAERVRHEDVLDMLA